MNNAFTQQEVLLRLQGVFDHIFMDSVQVSAELNAKDVEEWDSLVHISLVVAVEKEFKIRFRVGEVESTKNVGEFANLILKRVKESRAS
jgi:acyl carrier protein